MNSVFLVLLATKPTMNGFKDNIDVELVENGSGSGTTWSEAEEKAVRRKLDFNLVPVLTLMYLVCFVSFHRSSATLSGC